MKEKRILIKKWGNSYPEKVQDSTLVPAEIPKNEGIRSDIKNSSEAAAIINRNKSKSKSRLYKLTSLGLIPHYKNGRSLFFLESELRAWLLSNPVKTRETIEQEIANDFLLKGGKR